MKGVWEPINNPQPLSFTINCDEVIVSGVVVVEGLSAHEMQNSNQAFVGLHLQTKP